jgi:hypothetical protein
MVSRRARRTRPSTVWRIVPMSVPAVEIARLVAVPTVTLPSA